MHTLLRSLLFVPGTRPDRFAKAIASGADAVVFDLEDSVEATRKTEARLAISAFLRARTRDRVQIVVRVNAFGSAWCADDLDFIQRLEIVDAVILPKAEWAAQVIDLAGAAGSARVLPLLETARGVLEAASIASASPSVQAVLFGAEDLTAQIGVPRTIDGEALLFARSQVVLAATAAGIDAIDAVFTHLADKDGLRRDASRACALGFRGKMAIHPAHIATIHEVFSPSDADVAAARRVVEAADAARAKGEGVIRLDDRMTDAPVVMRARRVLALAGAIADASSRKHG